MDAFTKDKRRKDPTTPSAAHQKMAPRIQLANTLMDGTDALREAAETYLPKYPQETQDNYDARLERSVLINYFRRSVESLIGKPFSVPITLGDDMDVQLHDLSEDIDRQGNNIDVFSRKSFRDGLLKGLTHILVEFPNTAAVATLDDERKLGAMPYFVHIPPESIIAAYCEYRNGEEFLTHVRIYEEETVRVGFDEEVIQRVRILEPGIWKVYRKNGKKWDLEDEGVTTLDYIPLLTFYADREDFMVARSPLLDLAHANLAHYQSASDQRNILTVARFPMLAASGVTDDEATIKVGPRQLLQCSAKDGKFYYVEHTGKAIETGRQDLEDLKAEMSILGIELLSKSGNATATAKAIDTAENLSMLQALTLVFKDVLERAYEVAAEWMKIASGGGSIKINTDFGLSMNETADLAALQFARTNGDISREGYLNELKRRNTLSADYDMEADILKIEEEKTQDLADQQMQLKMQAEFAPKPVAPGAK
jgi:hypothetical protein